MQSNRIIRAVSHHIMASGVVPNVFAEEKREKKQPSSVTEWQSSLDHKLLDVEDRIIELQKLLSEEKDDEKEKIYKNEWQKLTKLKLALIRVRNLLKNCKNDQCMEEYQAILEKTARVSYAILSRPLIETEPATEETSSKKQNETAQKEESRQQGDPLDALHQTLTLADATMASSLQRVRESAASTPAEAHRPPPTQPAYPQPIRCRLQGRKHRRRSIEFTLERILHIIGIIPILAEMWIARRAYVVAIVATVHQVATPHR